MAKEIKMTGENGEQLLPITRSTQVYLAAAKLSEVLTESANKKVDANLNRVILSGDNARVTFRGDGTNQGIYFYYTAQIQKRVLSYDDGPILGATDVATTIQGKNVVLKNSAGNAVVTANNNGTVDLHGNTSVSGNMVATGGVAALGIVDTTNTASVWNDVGTGTAQYRREDNKVVFRGYTADISVRGDDYSDLFQMPDALRPIVDHEYMIALGLTNAAFLNVRVLTNGKVQGYAVRYNGNGVTSPVTIQVPLNTLLYYLD